MPCTAPSTRADKTTAIHAVVAVLLALMVSATSPLGGATQDRACADVRLVQCSAEHAAAIRVAVLADCTTDSCTERCAPAQFPTQLIRAVDRARWSCALPPPARA